MTAVSNIQSREIREANQLIPKGKDGGDQVFAHARTLARADMLLKGTDQYGKWQSIRQKNDKASVVDLAEKIMERHGMMENAKKNGSMDSRKFDALTKSIAGHGIFLFTSSQLAKPDRISETSVKASSLPELASPVPAPSVVSDRPAPEVSPGKIQDLHTVPALSPATAEEMVVDVVCGKYNLTPAMIALGNEKQILLPLGELSRILEFNIASDPGTGKAQGWFLSSDRTFSMDTASGIANIQGKTVPFSPEQIVTTKDDIYVDAKTLSKWFPMDLSYDFTRQSVSVDPREDLPFQTRMARHLSWKNRLGFINKGPQLPQRYPEYNLFETPVVDMGMSASFQKTEKNSKSTQGNYYLHAKGDLAWMNSELYLSGDEDDKLETARLTLKREDPDGNLLGAAHATKAAVGDIRVPDLPIVGGGKYERGARISNESLHRSSEYDSTFFEGSLSPGWDVEVYRNNVLLRNQQVGADGRYSFDQVPLYYGANNFTLKFYGPQGEFKEEKKQIMVGGDMMKPGHLEYEFSASQKDQTLFGVNDPEHSNGKGTGRFLAHYEYGLTPRVSIQGGFLSQHAGDRRHTYLHTGAKGSIADSYLTGDVVFDLDGGGYAVQALGQKKVGPLDLRLRQQFFHDFSTTGSPGSDPLQSRTSLSAFGRIKDGFFVQDIPFSLNFTNTRRESGSENSATANISTRIKNTYLNSSVAWHDREENSDDADLTGSSSISSEFKGLRLRGSVDYDLLPEKKLTRARLSAVKYLNDELSAEFSLSRNMNREEDDLTSASLGVNWNNGKWAISPRAGYNSDDTFTASVMLNTSLGAEPRTGRPVFSSKKIADHGAVSARVFHDKNNNKLFDEGDEPIANAKVAAVQAHQDAVTDENGIAFIRGLAKNRATDIALDTTTLEDPYWEPSVSGESLVPRSGHVDMIDIPVTATGEIDGILSLRRADGIVKELTHAPLQLVDGEDQVVAQTRSEYDGFYLFEKVPPGNYQVRLDPEFEETLNTKALAPIPVTISNEGNIVSGVDLAFVESGDKASGDSGIAVAQANGDVVNPANVGKLRQIPEPNEITIESVPEPALIDGPADLPELAAVPSPAFLPELKTIDGPGDLPEPAAVDIDAVPGPAPVSPFEAAASSGSIASASSDDDMNSSSLSEILAETPSIDETEAAVYSPSGNQQYGAHLSSYRSMEKAVSGILYQVHKYKDLLSESDFTVQKTDLGPEKGSWYRVVAGTASAPQGARQLADTIKNTSPYTKIVYLDHSSKKGVHLTSSRTMEGARQSIKKLQAAYPEALKDIPFSIVYKDLGEKKGAWYRVVAGSFDYQAQAQHLARQIRHKDPYCKPVAMENTRQLAVHAASYPSLERAVKGVNVLAKQTGVTPEHVSIRRVDLGAKGVWYRVLLGRFDDESQANTLAAQIQDQGQYARVMNFG